MIQDLDQNPQTFRVPQVYYDIQAHRGIIGKKNDQLGMNTGWMPRITEKTADKIVIGG